MFASRRRLIDSAVVATAVGLALLAVYLPGSADPPATAAADGLGAGVPVTVSTPSAAPVVTPTLTPTPTPTVAAGPTKLAPGEKPPQFVVFSFDGVGSTDRWKYYRDIAQDTGAKFTAYLSGTYWLPNDKRNLYDPPNHPVGSSDVGFGGTDADVRARMEQVQAAFAEGHEIGTHFLGHFCGPNGVAAFDSSDWRNELEQWYSIDRELADQRRCSRRRRERVARKDIIGARTPCLEGKRSAFLPVLADDGFRYDTSGWGYLQWPRKTEQTDLWDIPLQVLNMADTGREVLSMDYNFYEVQGQVTTAASRERMQDQMVRTYRNALDAVYNGNRAPLIIGHHFAEWNIGVYHAALGQFIRETCSKPDVQCVNFRELVDWLDAQDPAELARLRNLGIQRHGPLSYAFSIFCRVSRPSGPRKGAQPCRSFVSQSVSRCSASACRSTSPAASLNATSRTNSTCVACSAASERQPPPPARPGSRRRR